MSYTLNKHQRNARMRLGLIFAAARSAQARRERAATPKGPSGGAWVECVHCGRVYDEPIHGPCPSDDCPSNAPRFACVYCGEEVPDGEEPTQFSCCGEVGHTEPITGEA